MIATEHLPLLIGTAVWLAFGVWMYTSGWTIQRDYLTGGGAPALERLSITWLTLLIGAAALLYARLQPSLPAFIALAMVGAVSILVDARVRLLPNRYTAAMALGVAIGVGCAFIDEADRGTLALTVGGGALMWVVPMLAAYLVRSGVGLGDVKIAPVLGAALGTLGLQAALSGLVIAFVGAGLGALWALVRRKATLTSRIAMGPYLIGGALAAYTLWIFPGAQRLS